MKNAIEILKIILNSKLFYSAIILLISVFIFRGFDHLIKNARKNTKAYRNNKDKTITSLTLSTLRYAMIIMIFFILLEVNGINVGSMLAGLGIISVVVGLAIQDALKDIIRGLTIISDAYFKVGDIIKYNNVTGRVAIIGLRSTKMYDIANGNEITIANRNIEQVEKISKELYTRINFPYEIKMSKADQIIDTVKNYGLVELAPSSKDYCIGITCHPYDKLRANRIVLRKIADVMEENNIDIPYQQVDIHNK